MASRWRPLLLLAILVFLTSWIVQGTDSFALPPFAAAPSVPALYAPWLQTLRVPKESTWYFCVFEWWSTKVLITYESILKPYSYLNVSSFGSQRVIPELGKEDVAIGSGCPKKCYLRWKIAFRMQILLCFVSVSSGISQVQWSPNLSCNFKRAEKNAQAFCANPKAHMACLAVGQVIIAKMI